MQQDFPINIYQILRKNTVKIIPTTGKDVACSSMPFHCLLLSAIRLPYRVQGHKFTMVGVAAVVSIVSK